MLTVTTHQLFCHAIDWRITFNKHRREAAVVVDDKEAQVRCAIIITNLIIG